MAPRNPDRQVRVTVGQQVNRRVSLVYRRRVIDSNNGVIYNNDIECEGVLRLNPLGYGLSVLTDEGQSIGFFRPDNLLAREERMVEGAGLRGYDGEADRNYRMELLGDEVPFCGEGEEEGRMYYDCVMGEKLNGGFMETYRVWTIIHNRWVEITSRVMFELYGSEGNVRPWYPQGHGVSTFMTLFMERYGLLERV
jgi:hypothetical protein